jgi:multiple sugar transport system permease protein
MSKKLAMKPSNERASKITLTFTCWTTAILFFLPIAWIIATALKPKNTVLDIPPKILFVPTFQNLIDALTFSNTLDYFINSIIYSSIAVFLAIFVSFLAAYSFSRFKPAGTDFLMFLLLSTRFVPAAAFVIPFFQLFNILQLKDSFLGLILFYAMFSIPFSVWILKGFIDG